MAVFKLSGIFLVATFALTSAAALADTGNSSTTHAHKHRHVVIVEDDDVGTGYNGGVANLLGVTVGPEVANRGISVPQGAQPLPSSTRTRPMFGLFYEHQFIPYFALRTGLDYTQRGFSTTEGEGQAAITHDFAINYLELPVFAKGQYKFGVVTPYIMTGPFVGMVVGSGQVNQGNGGQNEVDIANNINSFNFGWGFGAGTTFAVAHNFNLEAGFRYSLGITNVVSNGTPGESVRLNSLQFLAGASVSL